MIEIENEKKKILLKAKIEQEQKELKKKVFCFFIF